MRQGHSGGDHVPDSQYVPRTVPDRLALDVALGGHGGPGLVRRRSLGQGASAGRRLMRRLPIACLFTVASCRMTPSPAPVPLEGTQQELSALAGEWTGQYWSKDTGRRGVIRFAMPEAADTGHGEVEITFSPTLRLVQDAAALDPAATDPDDDPTPKPCTVLNIRIVRVEH